MFLLFRRSLIIRIQCNSVLPVVSLFWKNLSQKRLNRPDKVTQFFFWLFHSSFKYPMVQSLSIWLWIFYHRSLYFVCPEQSWVYYFQIVYAAVRLSHFDTHKYTWTSHTVAPTCDQNLKLVSLRCTINVA